MYLSIQLKSVFELLKLESNILDFEQLSFIARRNYTVQIRSTVLGNLNNHL